jgi:hypothetical protein
MHNLQYSTKIHNRNCHSTVISILENSVFAFLLPITEVSIFKVFQNFIWTHDDERKTFLQILRTKLLAEALIFNSYLVISHDEVQETRKRRRVNHQSPCACKTLHPRHMHGIVRASRSARRTIANTVLLLAKIRSVHIVGAIPAIGCVQSAALMFFERNLILSAPAAICEPQFQILPAVFTERCAYQKESPFHDLLIAIVDSQQNQFHCKLISVKFFSTSIPSNCQSKRDRFSFISVLALPEVRWWGER